MKLPPQDAAGDLHQPRPDADNHCHGDAVNRAGDYRRKDDGVEGIGRDHQAADAASDSGEYSASHRTIKPAAGPRPESVP